MASRRSKRRRARRAWWPQLNLPHLEQRHWDLLGLGLVAFAAFFACIFYLDWAGGEDSRLDEPASRTRTSTAWRTIPPMQM